MAPLNPAEFQYLAGNLRVLRVARRLTQQKLAEIVGQPFTQCYVSGLEYGRWPQERDHVRRLAAALDVDEATLLRRPKQIAARGRQPVNAAAPAPAADSVAV